MAQREVGILIFGCEKKALVVGATAGLGKAIANELAGQGWSLVLISRGEGELETLQQQLLLVGAPSVESFVLDLHNQVSWGDFYSKLSSAPKNIFYVAGSALEGDPHGLSPQDIQKTMNLNFFNLASLVSFLLDDQWEGGGHLTFISSIASKAPRGKNLYYACAKLAAESFIAGNLRMFVQRSISTHIVVSGYLSTRQTHGKKLFPKPAPIEPLARKIVQSIDRGNISSYFPWYWGVISFLLAILPSRILQRLGV